MKLSQQAALRVHDRAASATLDRIGKAANDRKRNVYWIGFIEGALSSGRIEAGEDRALFAEAVRFATFFEDPDATDLAEDLRSRCFSSETDLMAQLSDIVAEKRGEIHQERSYTGTDEINEFLGFCAGVICDGRILEPEVAAILRRFRRSSVLTNAAAFRGLHRAVEAAMADRKLTRQEADDIREWIAQLVGDGYVDTGLPNIGAVATLDAPITDHEQMTVTGASFVLTGPMRMGPRAYVISEIERQGGRVQASVSKKTDYVVVSLNASRNWRTTHFGAKIERAKALIEQGCRLRFVSESALEKAVSLLDA